LIRNLKVFFNDRVKEANSIVITSHKSPDDDSVSSCLLVFHYLTKTLKLNQKNVDLVFTGEKNSRWDYFKNYGKVKYVDDLKNYIKNADVIIMLDGSGWHRFSNDIAISNYKGFTICIDHHPNPEDKHDLHLVSTDYVSCAEIVYKLLLEEEKLDTNLAETVFLGIWGDTGGMKYIKPENTSAFVTIKKLIDEGDINIQLLESKYMKISMRVFQLVSELVKNTKIKKIKDWPNTQYSYLESDMIDLGYDETEISDAYHLYVDQFMRILKDVDWGFVVTPNANLTSRVSARSLPGSVNVRLIFEKMNIGGGHDRAAGGGMNQSDVIKAIDEIFAWMKSNKPEMS